jgi:hypothetical protein
MIQSFSVSTENLMGRRHPRIDLVQDDENRWLYVFDGYLDLDKYEMTDDERSKWMEKLRHRRYQVTLIRDDNETVH